MPIGSYLLYMLLETCLGVNPLSDQIWPLKFFAEKEKRLWNFMWNNYAIRRSFIDWILNEMKEEKKERVLDCFRISFESSQEKFV